MENDEEAINPCPPEWLDTEDNALLRGDAIGDTVYTHRWILKCLFTITEGLPKYLNQTPTANSENDLDPVHKNEIEEEKTNGENGRILELDSEVEDAACQLWDMTVEKDVSVHLLNLEEVDILQLASLVFEGSCAPRLTEVLVGVVANLCCVEEGCVRLLRKKESSDELVSALHLLGSTSDVPTLCEVMRLVRLLLWHRVNRTSNALWAACPLLKLLCQDYFRSAITFLLKNSLSDTLISSLLDLLSSFLFICLPETGLNVASLYSTEEMVSSLVDILESKCAVTQGSLDQDQEKILHLSVMCLYAFIDTPGARLIQSSASKSDSTLESSLLWYLEREGRVESPEDLGGEGCEHVTRVLGLSQLLIPVMRLPSLILTVGRLMAMLQGEARQYSVSRSSSREEEGRKSSLDEAVFLLATECVDEKKRRRRSGGQRRRRSEEEKRKKEEEEEEEKRNRRFKTQVSNPLIEDCGWVSPPAPTMASPVPEGSPSSNAVVTVPVPEADSYRTPAKLKERNMSSTDVPPNLKELEEVLVDYCHQLLAFWWSCSPDVTSERRKEAQKVVLNVLDQCHAHEVLFILKAVRLKDHSLVPRLQEQILDSGSHRRLVALLAHMYQ